jgi:hypothetical protein
MTTINAVNLSLSGQSGTGSFAGTTSPTLVTPTLGAAAATSLAFSPSTGGIIGTTTNNSASAGIVGQFVNSIILSGSAVSLSSGTPKDLTSISLTAGDWDVMGNISFITNASTPVAYVGWLNLTSATQPDAALITFLTTTSFFNSDSIPVPALRVSITTTTTVYISASSTFSGGSLTMCGQIQARRVR